MKNFTLTCKIDKQCVNSLRYKPTNPGFEAMALYVPLKCFKHTNKIPQQIQVVVKIPNE